MGMGMGMGMGKGRVRVKPVVKMFLHSREPPAEPSSYTWPFGSN
jgi:hypothetical protein